MTVREGVEEPRRRFNATELITLLLLTVAFAYLVSPWDILPFSFFDDLAFVVVAFGLWLIVARQTPKRLRRSLISVGWIVVLVFSAIFAVISLCELEKR